MKRAWGRRLAALVAALGCLVPAGCAESVLWLPDLDKGRMREEAPMLLHPHSPITGDGKGILGIVGDKGQDLVLRDWEGRETKIEVPGLKEKPGRKEKEAEEVASHFAWDKHV